MLVHGLMVTSVMQGARCRSAVERTFVVRWLVGSIPHTEPTEISRSSHCSTTAITGSGMCYSVYVMVHIKDILLLLGKSCPCCGGSGFPLSLSLTYYVRRYITVKYIMLNESLNITFPSCEARTIIIIILYLTLWNKIVQLLIFQYTA